MNARTIGLVTFGVSMSLVLAAKLAVAPNKVRYVVAGMGALGIVVCLFLDPGKAGPKDWPLPEERSARIAEEMERPRYYSTHLLRRLSLGGKVLFIVMMLALTVMITLVLNTWFHEP